MKIKSVLEGTKVSKDYKKQFYNSKNPRIVNCDKITNLIETAENVYVCTDWHLWKANKEGVFVKAKHFDQVMENIEKLKENDLLIFLGDLVDDEFPDKKAVKKVLKQIKCRKIITMGNNDVYKEKFYRKHFDIVVDAFRYQDLVFSHYPLANFEKEFNIHGHIHGSEHYFDFCPRNIDVYRKTGDFVNLNEILKAVEEGFVNNYGDVIKR